MNATNLLMTQGEARRLYEEARARIEIWMPWLQYLAAIDCPRLLIRGDVVVRVGVTRLEMGTQWLRENGHFPWPGEPLL